MAPIERSHASPLRGDEPLNHGSSISVANVSDFWRWSCSDLLSNATRGVLAEFIVAKGLGIETKVRTEWDDVDLRLPDGITIEVKSSAYLQSWEQKKLSAIRFGIGPSKGWDAETNEYDERVLRRADLYVFALLIHKEMATVEPLNLEQWQFLVLSTSRLQRLVGNQKTIGLASLRKLGPVAATYGELARAVSQAMNDV